MPSLALFLLPATASSGNPWCLNALKSFLVDCNVYMRSIILPMEDAMKLTDLNT